MKEICEELGSTKSSASLWTRGAVFTPKPRNRGIGVTKPHPMDIAKLEEIAECGRGCLRATGEMSERDLFMVGIGLYAGDGRKGDGLVTLSNSNPALVQLFCRWFRRLFDVDEARQRLSLYLHEGLNIETANPHWSNVRRSQSPNSTSPTVRCLTPPSDTKSMNSAVHTCGTRVLALNE